MFQGKFGGDVDEVLTSAKLNGVSVRECFGLSKDPWLTDK